MATGQANAEIMRGGCPTLTDNHEQPILMSDRKGHNGITEDGTATTLTAQEKERPIIAIEGMLNETASRNQVLRLLRETYGAQEIFQWGAAVLDALQQADVLRQGVHESGVSVETEDGDKLDGSTLPCSELAAGWILRDMREQSECGCASQRWEPTEQQHRELAETVPELPHESAQTAQELLNMWSAGQGLGLLRQALSEIQEIRRSIDGVREEGGDAMTSVVRRLTPLE